MRPIRCLAAASVLVLAATGVAVADEAKSRIDAAMLLSIVAAPVDTRTSAFDEALRRPAPVAADPSKGEILEDGSVRYGNAVVTVRNPCPPGTSHWEPPVLPGRRR